MSLLMGNPLQAITVSQFLTNSLPLIQSVNSRMNSSDSSLPFSAGALAVQLDVIAASATTYLGESPSSGDQTILVEIRDTAKMQSAFLMGLEALVDLTPIATGTVATENLSAAATLTSMSTTAHSQLSTYTGLLSTYSTLTGATAVITGHSLTTIEAEYNSARQSMVSLNGLITSVTPALTVYANFADAFITAAQPTSNPAAKMTAYTNLNTAALACVQSISSALTATTRAGVMLTTTTTCLTTMLTQVQREAQYAQLIVLQTQIETLQQTLLTLTPYNRTATQTALTQKQTALFVLENQIRSAEIAAMITAAQGQIPGINNTALQQIAAYVALYQAKITTTLELLSRRVIGINPSAQTKQFVTTEINRVINEREPIINLLSVVTAMQTWAQQENSAVSSALNLSSFLANSRAVWSDLYSTYLATKTNVGISQSAQNSLSSAEGALSTYFAVLPTTVSDAKKIYQNIQLTGLILSAVAQNEFSTQLLSSVTSVQKDFALASSTPQITTDPSTNTPIAPTASGASIDLTPDSTGTLTQQIVGVNAQAIVIASGNSDGIARLREIALADNSVTKANAQIKIYVDKSAHIGLGTVNLSKNPAKALNILGGDNSVKLIPLGNGIFDINSDIIIAGNSPLVPAASFGQNATHRIIFTSDVERKITVLSGVELDLSGFNGSDSSYTDYGKQIVFAGKVKLLLEPGAKIRFPYMPEGKEAKAPLLYFNDESELIFLGSDNRDAAVWTDGLNGSNKVRNKILGVGAIWLNKNAKISILNTALVGVEADYNSPRTNVTISIQRHGELRIGTADIAGGAFQVGNMVDGGDGDANGPNNNTNTGINFVPRPTQIDFKLAINDPDCSCSIHREGFFGLGVGTINKVNNPNGETASSVSTPDAATAWSVQSLHNLANASIIISEGSFNHNNIGDGSNSAASVFAVGPLVAGGKYSLALGQFCKARVRGGGNILFVGSGVEHDNPLLVNIWDTAQAITFSSADTGAYNILAPDIIMRNRFSAQDITDPNTGETVARFGFGRGTVNVTDTSYTFSGPQEEFFMSLAMASYPDFANKFVAIGEENFDTLVGYVNGTKIKRQVITSALDTNSNTVNPSKAIDGAYLIGSRSDLSGNPTIFIVPQ